MANQIIRVTSGNDANDGLTLGTAVQTLTQANANALASEIVFYDPTDGLVDPLTTSTANTGVVTKSLLVTVLPAYYGQYDMRIELKRTGSGTWTIPASTIVSFDNVGFTIDHEANSTVVLFNLTTNAARYTNFINSKIQFKSTVVRSSVMYIPGAAAGESRYQNVIIDFNNIEISPSLAITATGSAFIDCDIINVLHTGSGATFLGTPGNCRFVRFGNIEKQNTGVNSYFFTAAWDLLYCTLLFKCSDANTSIFQWTAADINNSQNSLFINYGTVEPNFIDAASAITLLPSQSRTFGRHALWGITDILGTNVTWNDRSSDLAEIILTDDGVISTTFGDPDYLKPDNMDLINNAFISNMTIGAVQLPSGSGETNPDFILSTAPNFPGNINPNTVRDVNPQGTLDSDEVTTTAGGNYVKPAASIVKDGENFGVGEVGTYDPITGQWVAVTANQLIDGQSALQDGETINGTQKIPAPTDVREAVETGLTVGSLNINNEANLPDPSDVDSRANNYGENLDIVPTLDIDTEANIPNEANVETGSPNFGRDLNKIPSFTPDYPAPQNVAENDTTDGVQGQIPLNEITTASIGNYVKPSASVVAKDEEFGVNETGTFDPITGNWEAVSAEELESGITKKQNGVDVVGTNKGENFNSADADDIAIGREIILHGETLAGTQRLLHRFTKLEPEEVKELVDYLYDNESFTGTFAPVADYPDVKFVLFPKLFDNGNRQGTLGKVDINANVPKQMMDNALFHVQSILGESWGNISYFETVDKNIFSKSDGFFGMYHQEDSLARELTGGRKTFDITYEIKLIKQINNKNEVGDNKEREIGNELKAKMKEIQVGLVKSEFGYSQNVRTVRDFTIFATEKAGDKTMLCRAEITVNYII